MDEKDTHQTSEEKQAQAPARISRRAFLRAAGISLAGGLLAACGTVEEQGWQAGDFRATPTPANLLPSPMPPAGADPEALAAVEGLEPFMALSSLLTGFEDLDPRLGQVYLRSLQADAGSAAGLEQLYEQAGLQGEQAPENFEALEASGIFDQAGTRDLADQIITLWYTGVYSEGEEQVVATFVDSLAWKSLTFTKPLTICGSFGFWAQRPRGEF